MSKIRILPEILSNKIAAGEVVERPASVVKELLENSIDAGSSKIIVEIENGGRSLIRVSDDGSGMTHDDAILSLERYATSKIKSDKDLFAIGSLGFRGEALPSIASVSKFSMVSRERGADSGTLVQVDGGKIRNVSETGAPEGTMITVGRLFYNIPARRKFLKSTSTEMGHIYEVMASVALGWPSIQFKLLHNARLVKSWPASEKHLSRVWAVLGKEAKSNLRELNYVNNDISISGWISSPMVTRSTSQKIYIYVNNRFIRDRGLQHALFQGYLGRLMKGRFPLAAIFIRLPFDSLDVNVHPTKKEVRFSGYKRVYETLKKAVFQAWDENNSEPEGTSAFSGEMDKTEGSFGSRPDAGFSWNKRQSVREARPAVKPGYNNEEWVWTPPPPAAEADYHPEEDELSLPRGKKEAISAEEFSSQGELWEKRFKDLRVIGQIFGTYIVCETNDGLILVDQHAAHERIVFEELKAREKGRPIESQRLLMPETIELGYNEVPLLERLIPKLEDFGLGIEPFGGNTFVIKSAPALIADMELKPLVMEMVDTARDVGFSGGIETVLDQCLMLMACHSALRAHHSLKEREMKELMARLDQCENPFHCPHGRPIRVKWPLKLIEKSFKRVL